MALGLAPRNIATTLGKIHDISDEIWFLAGDRSKDINWYTKRALLSKIYAATETFMVQDQSHDFEETW